MLIEDLCMWPRRPVAYWVFQDVSREQPSETRSDHSGSFILSSTFKSLRGPTEDEEPHKFELIRRCNLIDFGVFHISLDKVWRGAFITGTFANFLSPTSLLLLSLNHKSVSNVGATVPCWRLQLSEKRAERLATFISSFSTFFQGLHQCWSRYFFFSLKLLHQSKKQQWLIMKSLYEIHFTLRSEEPERLRDTKEVKLVCLSSKRLTDNRKQESYNTVCPSEWRWILTVTKPVLLCCQNILPSGIRNMTLQCYSTQEIFLLFV